MQESAYSRIMGLPISWLGLGSYAVVAVLALLSRVAALSPLRLLAADNEGAKALGVVTTGGLCIGWLLAVIAVGVTIHILLLKTVENRPPS